MSTMIPLRARTTKEPLQTCPTEQKLKGHISFMGDKGFHIIYALWLLALIIELSSSKTFLLVLIIDLPEFCNISATIIFLKQDSHFLW